MHSLQSEIVCREVSEILCEKKVVTEISQLTGQDNSKSTIPKHCACVKMSKQHGSIPCRSWVLSLALTWTQIGHHLPMLGCKKKVVQRKTHPVEIFGGFFCTTPKNMSIRVELAMQMTTPRQ
jgi:hypothetical protein